MQKPGLQIELLEERELLDATDNLNFVGQAYLDILGRQADSGGLNYYANLLNVGQATRQQVALDLLDSAENYGLLVQNAYEILLNRPADPGGLGAWTSFLAKGGSIEQLDGILAGSNEFFQLHGGTDAGFLAGLYLDALNRPIDPGGEASFAQALAAGAGTQQVAQTIYASAEYQTDIVQGFYLHYLRRSADPGGLAAFTTDLAEGIRDNQVVATLMASPEYAPGAPVSPGDPVLSASQVQTLLNKAAAADANAGAIIAIVDRDGNVLGVQVEAGVSPQIQNNPALLTFAVDGALAEARTAAFFANDQAPLTSRTVGEISQSTMTEREVDSSPDVTDTNSPSYGPGFVAAVGIGGEFPPGVADTPSADLYDIEATNRDTTVSAGPDGIMGTADDIVLPNRFNVPSQYLPANIPADQQLQPPNSYGYISGIDPNAQPRGLGTLPGGIPIYSPLDANGNSEVVGGIGVFFPGQTGYATEENSILSSTYDSSMPDLSLEAEYMAFVAAGPTIPKSLMNTPINLGGITLNVVGPGGPQGITTLVQFGQGLGTRSTAGDKDLQVDKQGDDFLNGVPVPSGWLVTPHAGDGLTAADVEQMVDQGIAQAEVTRSAFRLPESSTASMVFAVSDKEGDILGLYRMPDATVFSIGVAVAKSRNVAYYADSSLLQPQDEVAGVPAGTAFSSRTFRYLALPGFPEGSDSGIPGPFSILNDGGVSLQNGLTVGQPLPASAFQSVQGYNAFHPDSNFRDPIDPANQNGVVFFPGGVPLFKVVNGDNQASLVGGLGVSGDGVNQDDVITGAASVGYLPPANLRRADQVSFQGVNLPYLNYDRNPEG